MRLASGRQEHIIGNARQAAQQGKRVLCRPLTLKHHGDVDVTALVRISPGAATVEQHLPNSRQVRALQSRHKVINGPRSQRVHAVPTVDRSAHARSVPELVGSQIPSLVQGKVSLDVECRGSLGDDRDTPNRAHSHHGTGRCFQHSIRISLPPTLWQALTGGTRSRAAPHFIKLLGCCRWVIVQSACHLYGISLYVVRPELVVSRNARFKLQFEGIACGVYPKQRISKIEVVPAARCNFSPMKPTACSHDLFINTRPISALSRLSHQSHTSHEVTSPSIDSGVIRCPRLPCALAIVRGIGTCTSRCQVHCRKSF